MNNKKTLFSILFTMLLAMSVMPVIVFAQTTTVSTILGNVQANLVGIGAVIVIIAWIIAGLLYLTSAGSTTRMDLAKKAMYAAIAGTALIVISAFAYGMINAFLMNAPAAPAVTL